MRMRIPTSKMKIISIEKDEYFFLYTFTRNINQYHPKMQSYYRPQQTFHDETRKRYRLQRDQDVFALCVNKR